MKTFSQLKRMMLIFNPVSGRRASLRFLPDIISIFSQNGYAVTVFPTAQRGDATEFAQGYASEFDIIVCIGGDGTLNEVITGIIRGGHDIPLGYIPSGSTNDFASCHGISSDAVEAANNIVNGKPKKIDIGMFGDAVFAMLPPWARSRGCRTRRRRTLKTRSVTRRICLTRSRICRKLRRII